MVTLLILLFLTNKLKAYLIAQSTYNINYASNYTQCSLIGVKIFVNCEVVNKKNLQGLWSKSSRFINNASKETYSMHQEGHIPSIKRDIFHPSRGAYSIHQERHIPSIKRGIFNANSQRKSHCRGFSTLKIQIIESFAFSWAKKRPHETNSCFQKQLMCSDLIVKVNHTKLAVVVKETLLPFPPAYLVKSALSTSTDILLKKIWLLWDW